VFRELEASLEAGAARSPRLHALHAPFFAQLARADAFLADVRVVEVGRRCRWHHSLAALQIHFHGGPAGLAPPTAATADYCARIAELGKGTAEPLLLLAYAHTLYLALLSGGQLLERMLRGSMLLPRGRGTEIFRFAALPPRAHARFKRELRTAVDSLVLADGDAAALLQEKRSIFWRNDRVIIATMSDARGSLVVAYARLLRASLFTLLASRTLLAGLIALLAAAVAAHLGSAAAAAAQLRRA
jgi:hypothetical protein